MNVLDLFSGIGGFSLGLERAGMRTVAFCEIDPYCRAVLRKHWPDVRIFEDVTKLHGSDVPGADVICGGFPCQDISVAGKGAGIEGERSGLWKEYARLIGEIRPRYVIVENVAALLGRGLSTVLGDLSALGYDAEWHVISAADVGAPHRRERVWIVAYPISTGGRADAAGYGLPPESAQLQQAHGQACADHDTAVRGDVADSDSEPQGRLAIAWRECRQWLTEPDVGRVAHGVPARVDRLRALGNAVVPQIPEIIGRAIMKAAA